MILTCRSGRWPFQSFDVVSKSDRVRSVLSAVGPDCQLAASIDLMHLAKDERAADGRSTAAEAR